MDLSISAITNLIGSKFAQPSPHFQAASQDQDRTGPGVSSVFSWAPVSSEFGWIRIPPTRLHEMVDANVLEHRRVWVWSMLRSLVS